MGLRGRLAPVESLKAPDLSTLEAPLWLGEAARGYWELHAANLATAGLLTQNTADSFALLCDLWERVRAMKDAPTTRSYLDTVKAFVSLAKVFRLLPTETPKAPVTDRYAAKKEFDFE